MIDKKKAMAFDDESTEQVDVIPEKPGAPEMEMAEESEMESPAGDTATLGIEMLGGQKVSRGDVVRLEVVDVSDEDGTVTVKYAHPKSGSIAKAAAAFNEGT